MAGRSGITASSGIGNAFATNYGLPRWFAALAMFFEIVGGAALVIGLFTRFFAAALAIELLIAMFAAHWAKGFCGRRSRAATNMCCSSASCASSSRSAAAAGIRSTPCCRKSSRAINDIA